MKLLSTLLIAMLAPLAVLAQVPDCKSPESATAARHQIDATLSEVGDDARGRMAQSELALEAKTTSLGWTREEGAAFIKKIRFSSGFRVLGEEKQTYVTELGKVVMSVSGPEKVVTPQSVCDAAVRLKQVAGKIKEISIKEYAYLSGEIAAAGRVRSK